MNNAPRTDRRHPPQLQRRNLPSALRALRRADEGVSALEFAIITPLLLTMLLGLLDYAIGIFNKMEMVSSVRAGMQYALLDDTNFTAMRQTILDSTALDTANLTVPLPAQSCQCPDTTPVACAGTCAAGEVQTYVLFSASYSHTPFFLPGPWVFTTTNSIRTR